MELSCRSKSSDRELIRLWTLQDELEATTVTIEPTTETLGVCVTVDDVGAVAGIMMSVSVGVVVGGGALGQ